MSQEESRTKKLKVSKEEELGVSAVLQSQDADLEVVVGGDGKEGGDKKCVRFFHSAILASKSKYVDTMLATPMKEKETYKISFVDTPVETFDRALKFALSSFEARKMRVEDVLVVAKFYDQYEFTDGLKLCDKVLLEYFQGLSAQQDFLAKHVDEAVEAITLSAALNFTDSCAEGSRWIRDTMTIFRSGCLNSHLASPAMFRERHITKLVPVMLDLLSQDSSFLSWLQLPEGLVKPEQIKNSLFPVCYTRAAYLRDLEVGLGMEQDAPAP